MYKLRVDNFWTEKQAKNINLQAMIDQAVKRTVDSYAPGDTTIHIHLAGAPCAGREHLLVTKKDGNPHIERVTL